MNINHSLKKTPIAVIGLSSIFADAKNIEEYWQNIIQGKDSITDVPENRWKIEDYYDSDLNAPDKTYCKKGGFLPDIDFNPMEFGLPPNILEVTDVSQLLGLIAARDAFEDAGYGKDSEKFTKQVRQQTGVILGVGGGQKLLTSLGSRLQYPIWEKALRSSGIEEPDIAQIIDKIKKAYVGWNENSFPGMLGNVVAGRITNRFDLGGINSVVDAACAASLSAIKMSLSELVEGRSDMMLTGGVDTDNSPTMYMSFSKTPAFSKSGVISPMSDDADGMLIGEGIGMMVLKRLEDAERDGDRVYAVIKGVGASSDGRFKSVYAPRSSGQALAMSRAYDDAGYSPNTVGLVEAHGTGTGAGDPTEFNSMKMVFGNDEVKKQYIALGSVKSQIGHTKSSAGVAGMIKATLSLHHRVLPPTINVNKPNSKFNIDKSAFYINTETRPWLKESYPRRAAVSAFGFGGVNVHITLEEYEGTREPAYKLHQPYKTVLLEAFNAKALKEICETHLIALKNEDVFANLVKESESIKPAPENVRVGFVAESREECIEKLNICIQNLDKEVEEWQHPKGVYFRSNGIDKAAVKTAALFSGQGSQYIGMGKELANAFPEVAECFEKVDSIFYKKDKSSLSEIIFPIPVFSQEEREIQQKKLTETQYAQPAIGALSMGQYKVLQKAGFNADFSAGHSFGELTALWMAGTFDDDTFLAMASTRGEAMAAKNTTGDSGKMLVVKSSVDETSKSIASLTGITIANVNSNKQTVLGGGTQDILKAKEHLEKQGFDVIEIPVSAAFHTDYVKHAKEEFSSFISKQKFTKPEIPVLSNTTGDVYPSNLNSLKSILKNQLLNPVLFKNQIENLYENGARIFVEFGPKSILTNLVNEILEGKEFWTIAMNANAKQNSDHQFRIALIQLRVLGVSLDNVDAHKRVLAAKPPKTKLNTIISGNNYISEPTKQTYEKALSDGFKVSKTISAITEPYCLFRNRPQCRREKSCIY